MATNKSIDGLVPRSAKSPRSSSTEKKHTKKPGEHNFSSADPLTTPNIKRPTTIKPKEKAKKIIISNDSLEISVDGEEILEETTKEVKPSAKPIAKAEDFLAPLEPLQLDEPTKSRQKSKTEKKEKKPKSKVRRIVTIVILAIVLILIAGVSAFILWGNDIIAKITGGQGTVLDLITLTKETYDPLKTDANGRTNILAFGTSGYNMEGDEGNGVHDGAQLTDSIMMISIDQQTGDIAMLSLPRDLKASPTCTATGKINEVYWCNGGSGTATIEQEAEAANALMTEVGSILGVDFQYFAHLNWGSLVYIVDTLGGITVTLDEDIMDYYWTGAVFEAGVPYTINGEQALGLARARHGTIGGDFSRGSSQQKILIGIKDKIFEKDFSITDLMGLAGALGDNLRTNFSLSEMKTLAHLTEEFDLNNARQISLVDYNKNIYYMTTGTINGISYVLPSAGVGNYGAIQDFVSKNLSSDPRDYEEPSILVLNATETAGLASSEQANLIAAGYTDVDVDDAPELPEGETYPEGTTIYELNSKPGSAVLLKAHYDSNLKPADSLPEAISRNYDFVIILNPQSEEE